MSGNRPDGCHYLCLKRTFYGSVSMCVFSNASASVNALYAYIAGLRIELNFSLVSECQCLYTGLVYFPAHLF